MRVQKIASLENRLIDYRRERFTFFTQTVPMLLGIGAIVNVGLLYLVDRLSPNGLQNWAWIAVILVGCFSVPAIQFLRPARPTEEDVARDQWLRRTHGLDETIED